MSADLIRDMHRDSPTVSHGHAIRSHAAGVILRRKFVRPPDPWRREGLTARAPRRGGKAKSSDGFALRLNVQLVSPLDGT